MDQILDYLKNMYEPLAVIGYGSFADGSNNEGSDFDALVIAKDHPLFHDVSFVGGIQLDVFVYPQAFFEDSVDWENFIQLFDGRIILDTDGVGQRLLTRIQTYIHNRTRKSPEEIRTDIAWCRKMLLRTKRMDPEGMFRWHWLLTDSLEIFCLAAGHPYFGPKKSLKWMEKEHPQAFECYTNALSHLAWRDLEAWVELLEECSP